MEHEEVDRLVTAIISDPEKAILVGMAKFIVDYEERLEKLHQKIAETEFTPFVPRRAKRLAEHADAFSGMQILLAAMVEDHAGPSIEHTDSHGVARWLVHRIRLESTDA